MPSSSSSSNIGLGHIMPHRRTRNKKEKKRRKNQFHDHQSLPTRNVLLPASAPAVIVMSAALVGVLFYT